MVPDHGFARVGTMQVQAIMPPLTLAPCWLGAGGLLSLALAWRTCSLLWVRAYVRACVRACLCVPFSLFLVLVSSVMLPPLLP